MKRIYLVYFESFMTGGHVVAGSNPVTPNIKAASTKSEAVFL